MMEIYLYHWRCHFSGQHFVVVSWFRVHFELLVQFSAVFMLALMMRKDASQFDQ